MLNDNSVILTVFFIIDPLNAELNPICHLLALLGAHHILHVSRIRVKTSLFTEGRYVFRLRSSPGESEYGKGDCECLVLETDLFSAYFL
jgi:hypothetical protein